MRKSFTRLFSLFMLFSMLSFFAVAQVPELSPAEHETNVRPGETGTTFTMTFAEGTEITPNSGAGIIGLYSWNAGAWAELQTLQATTTLPAAIVITNNEIEVTFDSSLLDEQGWYYITVSPDAFEVGGVAWNGLEARNPGADASVDAAPGGDYDWEFQVGDFTGPLVNTFPADDQIHVGYGGTGVAPDIDADGGIMLAFDEDIKLNGGLGPNSTPFQLAVYHANGNVVDLIVFEDLAAAGNFDYVNPGTGESYNVTLDSDGTAGTTHNRIKIVGNGASASELLLLPLNEYYIRVTTGAIEDMSGNVEGAYLGQNDNTAWNFTAADNVAPIVTFDIPAEADFTGVAGTTIINVSQTPTLQLTFADDGGAKDYAFVLQKNASLYDDAATAGSADVDPVKASDLNKFITVVDVATTHNIAINWAGATIANNVVSIPVSNLESNTVYTVTVNGAGATIDPEDGEGNEVVTTTFTFKTGDFARPQVAAAPTVDRASNKNTLLNIYATSAQINDERADAGAPWGNNWYNLASTNTTLDVYVLVVDHAATAPTAAEVKDGGQMMTWDNTAGRYELEKADFGLECETEYDVYFYVEDKATSMSGVNVMTDADVAATKVDVVATDLCFAAPGADDLTFDDPVVGVTTATTDVPKNSQIIIAFDEVVTSADWNAAVSITVPDGTFLPDDANSAPDVVLFNAVLQADNKTLIIDEISPDRYEQDNATTAGDDYAELLSGVTYTVTINKNLFTDDAVGAVAASNAALDDDHVSDDFGSNNKLAANVVYTFTVEDYEGPIADFDPVDASGVADPTTVPIDVNPTITFNERIYDAAGNPISDATADLHFELVEVGGANPNVIIDAQIDATGTVVAIVPSEDLKSEQVYRIVITQLLYDENGWVIFNYNDIGDITAEDIESFADGHLEVANSMTSEFETEDITAPTIAFAIVEDDANAANANPADDNVAAGLTDLAVTTYEDALIRITFSEGVREVASNTLIEDADPNMIRTLIDLTGTVGAIEFEVVQVINPADNPPAAGAPNDNPTIVYINPIDYNVAGGFLFEASESYTVSVTGVEDDNANLADDSAVFTMAAVAIPAEIVATVNIKEGTEAAGPYVALTEDELVITFDRPVNAAAGATATITIVNINGAASAIGAYDDVDLTAGVVSGGSTVFTYDLTGLQDVGTSLINLIPFESDALYNIVISADAFAWTDDVSVTWPDGAVEDYDFATADATGPEIDLTAGVGVDVASGAGWDAAVAWDDVIEMTFTDPNNDIDFGTGNMWIKRVDNGLTIVELATTAEMLSITNNVLSIDLSKITNLLEFNTEYFIEMDGSFITDTDDNEFVWNTGGANTAGGFFGNTTLTFTTFADTPDVEYVSMAALGGNGWVPEINANDVDLDIQYLYIPFTGPATVNPAATNAHRIVINNNSGGTAPEASVPITLCGVEWPQNDLARISVAAIKNADAAFDFRADLNYWIDVEPGCFVKSTGTGSVVADEEGNTWADGQSDFATTDGWYFTTTDLTDPQIASVAFSATETDGTVDNKAKVIVTFTEPVELVGANTWDNVFDFDNPVAVVFGVDGGKDTGTAAEVDSGVLSTDGMTVTLTMDADFDITADIRTVTITTNAGTFQDKSAATNDNIGGAGDWVTAGDAVFVVEDLRLPTPAITTIPATALDGISVDIEVTVDEPCTAYVLAVEDGADIPTEVEMTTLGQAVTVAKGGVAKAYTYTGLTECEDYDFYVLAIDNSVNANVSDANVAAGKQPVGPYNVETADVTEPELAAAAPTSPAAGETIELFTRRYSNDVFATDDADDTKLVMYFDEPIQWEGGVNDATATANEWFKVREYDTNVAIDVEVRIINDADGNRVEIDPINGVNWAAETHYYVECDFNIIEDIACTVGASPSNDWTSAFYHKQDQGTSVQGEKSLEWDFYTGVDYEIPNLVTAAFTPEDGETEVVLTGNDWFTIEYNQPVAINYGASLVIYIYKYDDASAPAQEIIPVTPTYVQTDGNFVKILVKHVLTDTYKEHYRIVLPATMVRDANWDTADATTQLDYTPTVANANALPAGNVTYNFASANDTHANGVHWDFWAIDAVNPNAYWTSTFVNDFTGSRNYPTEEDRIANFPTTDANADQEDFEVGANPGFPDRNVYLSFDEGVYYGLENTAIGGVQLGTQLADGQNVAEFFTFEDSEGNDVAFTAEYINAAGENHIEIIPTVPFESVEEYTITVDTDAFVDIDDNALSTPQSDSYVFTTWIDESPTVEFAVEQSTYDGTRAATRPEVTITFNRPVLIADNYQPLLDIDVQNLVQFVTDPGGVEVEFEVVSRTDNRVFVIRPTEDLDSEQDYMVRLLSDGNTADGADADGDGVSVDVDLVDNVRIYTLNSNAFVQNADPGAASNKLDDRTFTFTVEDDVQPGVANFFPTGTDVSPLNPLAGALGATAGAQFYAIEFDENIVLNTAVTDPIVVRRAYATGPQSEGPGSIFQRIYVDNAEIVVNGNELWLPIAGTDAEGPLEDFQGYYVHIPAGFVQDKAGLDYEGIDNNTTWTFTTDDGTDPTVVASYPDINADPRPINFPKFDDWWLRFDENIQRGTGYIYLYKRDDGAHGDLSDGNAIMIINVADEVNCIISGSDPVNGLTSDVLTIKHDDLIEDDIYYIRYDAGIVKDLATAGANDTPERYDFSWDFNTSAHDIPALIGVTPLDETAPQEGVLTMTFDPLVDVQLGTGNIRIYEYYYTAGAVWDSRLVTTIDIQDASQVSFADNVVTITPDYKLDDAVAKYYVLVDATAIENTTTGDTFVGIADDTEWFFNTVDELDGPVLVSNVTTGDTCLDPHAEIELTLTLTDYNGIMAGAGNFEIYNAEGDVLALTVPAVDPRVAVTSAPDADNKYTDPQTVVITLAVDDLAEETDYYVMVGANAIMDASNGTATAFDGSVIEAGTWAFSTNDMTAPDFVVDTFGPIGNDEEADVVLTVTFDEPVQPGTGVLTITDGVEYTEEFAVTAKQIDGAVVTIPLTGLADETTFTVTYGAGFVKDLPYGDCGTTNDCLAFAGTWEFTTDDNTAPVIEGEPMGDNELATVTITINADEPVTPVAGKKVIVTDGADFTEEIDVADLTADAENKVFTTEVVALADNTTFTITVESGAFVDGAINPNETAVIAWSFATGDNTQPTQTAVAPTGDFESYLDPEVQQATITFDESVTFVDGSVVTVMGTTGDNDFPVTTVEVVDNVATITWDGNLGFEAYTVTVPAGAFEDGNNNPSEEIIWTFTIGDDTFDASCLAGTNFVPFDGTMNVAKNVDLEITFCEKVVPGSPEMKINIYEVDATDLTALFAAITVTADMISADGLTVTIPVTNLEDNTSYCVLIEAGAIEDEAGNEYAGISNPTWWNFTTGDNTAPTLTISENIDEAAAEKTETVTLTFDEAVYGVATGVTVTADGVAVTPVISGVDGDKVYTVEITAADAEVVVVTVDQTITDGTAVLNENALDMVYTYTYTVGDNSVPTLTVTAPVAPIATSFEVGLLFSETVTGTDGITVEGATSFNVTGADDTYTVAIVADEEAVVTVTVPATIADESVAGGVNNFAGEVLTYTVGDFTAPTVTADPVTGADLEADFTVELTFSDDAIVEAADITVDGATTVGITNEANVYTVAITAPDETDVTITVANDIVDEAGNAITGDLAFTYTTGDNTAPTIATIVEPSAPITTPFDVTVTFSEPVNGVADAITLSAGTFTVTGEDGDTEYTFTVTVPEQTEVTVTVGTTITDLAGNAFAGVTKAYTTGDFTAPTLVSVTPNASTLTNNHPDALVLTLSEDVVLSAAGGKAYIVKAGAVNASVTIPLTAAMINGDEVTITYDATVNGGLDKDTQYYVLVDNDALVDAAGNAFAGIEDDATWTFTTGDFATPIDITKTEYKVYPNPFADYITVDTNGTQLSRVIITSMTGQKVKEIVSPTNTIQTSDLGRGVYFIQLFVDDVVAKTERIVKR